MKILKFKNRSSKVLAVRDLIKSAGNKIGSVHFKKRSDGSKRKISYRLHVKKPTYAKAPSGHKSFKRKGLNDEHDLITVFSTNTVRYDGKGRMNGRGEYRSIPLDTVYRICVNGEIYKIC